MCRLAAYFGPPISLEQFLLEPEHSLVNQSWQPREMREAKMNADGFGVSWFAEDGRAASYKHTQPIWSDPNLTSLARSLKRDRWLASVRSATLVNDISYANTQPFTDDAILFTHNGYLEHFTSNWRGAIRHRLSPEVENKIHGTTDSEYLFALFYQHLQEIGDIAEALAAMVSTLDQIAGKSRALLNFVVSSPGQLVALRHALADESPSLYYHIEKTNEGDAVRIASEAMTADNEWSRIDENRMVIVDDRAEISITDL